MLFFQKLYFVLCRAFDTLDWMLVVLVWPYILVFAFDYYFQINIGAINENSASRNTVIKNIDD